MTLTDVQKNFTTWRESRCRPKEKIPDELWAQVASIYKSYSPSLICRSLGLSSQSLKLAMQGDGFASFMPASLVTPEMAMVEQPVCELSLERLGARLTLKVPLSVFDMVFSKLAGHMPC
jgi:hypothetical protein